MRLGAGEAIGGEFLAQCLDYDGPELLVAVAKHRQDYERLSYCASNMLICPKKRTGNSLLAKKEDRTDGLSIERCRGVQDYQ